MKITPSLHRQITVTVMSAHQTAVSRRRVLIGPLNRYGTKAAAMTNPEAYCQAGCPVPPAAKIMILAAIRQQRIARKNMSGSLLKRSLLANTLKGKSARIKRNHPSRRLCCGHYNRPVMRRIVLCLASIVVAGCLVAAAAQTGSAPLVITTPASQSAVLGKTFTLTLAAKGGSAPYVWQVGDGTLPPGLSLDPNSGVIKGTPKQAGEFYFTLAVADAGGPPQRVQREFTLTVTGPSTPLDHRVEGACGRAWRRHSRLSHRSQSFGSTI